MFCTTDFAENIVARRKYELAEQHFHKIEILLLGQWFQLSRRMTMAR